MNKNYDLLFEKEEKLGNELSLKVLENIYSLLDGYEANFDDCMKYSEENFIFKVICQLCAPYISEFTKNSKISKLEYSDIIQSHDINFKKNIIKISTKDQMIKAFKLSEKLKGFSNKKYYSLKEFGNSKNEYKHLIEISKNLKKDNKIVTGYVYEDSDKMKSVHSWIEIYYKGEEYIIDFINNLIMNKLGYYYLNHVEKINEISSKDLKDDEQLFNEFNQILKLKVQEYLTFRNFIINDLEKNKHLIINNIDILKNNDIISSY